MTLEEPPKAPPGTWPENWRDDYAKRSAQNIIAAAEAKKKTDPSVKVPDLEAETAKITQRLGRYASPEAAIEALFHAQNRISSGDLKAQAPGKDAKPEEVAEWRKQNGVAATAAEYIAALPDGLVIGEVDKPLVNTFTERMHAKNVPTAIVQDAIKWYYDSQEQIRADIIANAERIRRETEDTLRKDWGDGYRREIGSIHGLLDQAPAGLKDLVMGATLADGTPLGSHVGALKWLNGLSREINPAATVVPGAGAGSGAAINDEIKGLEVKMADRNSDYWKGPSADAQQSRYRDLVDARLRMTARAGTK